ncbi:YeeE/YedE family protein [Ignatzschineria rhizosphaerae]|uniref:YeeE/YedE family protein n=1 Tax=Ignatzschineria rhizosphaerae TaxID=2923279 RepID=A0ABY3X7L3_9GAMM|nr:YeeE/YedE family protein [Ignatzschineria rhizosphaerae]UNM97457.1 YeeE/YedE family protein [Ignatzschineria rhizosphaerae]
MTWFSLPALLGGIVIGFSGLLLLIGVGRIMGVSGILNNLLSKKGMTDWRLLFVVGLLISPWIYDVVIGSLPSVEVTQSVPLLIIAGLLVGIGSALGSGCTSGHSICGISRLAPSSLIITGLFMLSGGIAVFILKHLIGG